MERFPVTLPFLAILGVGFPLHKPYQYSFYRWSFLHFRCLKWFGEAAIENQQHGVSLKNWEFQSGPTRTSPTTGFPYSTMIHDDASGKVSWSSIGIPWNPLGIPILKKVVNDMFWHKRGPMDHLYPNGSNMIHNDSVKGRIRGKKKAYTWQKVPNIQNNEWIS